MVMNKSPNNNTPPQRDLRDLHGDNRYKPIEEEILFRPLSRRLAKKLTRTQIHPDHVSAFGFALTVVVGLLFFSNFDSPIILAVLLFACLFFDKLDGDLARAKGIAGRKGQYIDGFLDAISEIILLIGIAHVVHPSTTLAMLSVVGSLLFVYHGVSAPFYLDLVPKPHMKTDVHTSAPTWRKHVREIFFFGRAKFFLLIIILTLVGRLDLLFYILPLLILYTVLIFLKNVFVLGLAKR